VDVDPLQELNLLPLSLLLDVATKVAAILAVVALILPHTSDGSGMGSSNRAAAVRPAATATPDSGDLVHPEPKKKGVKGKWTAALTHFAAWSAPPAVTTAHFA